MKSTRFWVILFAALLLSSVAGIYAVNDIRTDSTTAAIYLDGQLLQTLDLDGRTLQTIDLSTLQAPQQLKLAGITIVADSSGIRITHADCPDQLCVKQGTISNGLIPLVCLPNRLVIQIESNQAPPFDGVSS